MPQIPVTGQLLMRNMGQQEGRTLFMVVGIIAVPADQAWLDDHQYTVYSLNNGRLWVDQTAPIDRKQEARGMSADNILTAPWWRI